MNFNELGLSEKVLAAITTAGYNEPTPIQAQAIPHALQGRDILGIAQTGTGKTAAFVLPMLCRLEQGRARARMPRTLILEPTRELAAQVEEAFNKYGANHKLNVALLIGGVSFGDQETKIMRGADVLIATPGRLLDFHERGKLLLTGIDILVIDEADRMLDMGFIPDIERICKLVPFTRQTLFFSATMPPEITRLTEAFLQNPLRVEVSRVGTTATTITQKLVASHGGGLKRETLRQQLRSAENFRNAIIFANRKRDVAIVHKSLLKHGFSAGALHGDMDQPARMASLDAFKNGDVALLVCSDVAARGLDIPDVSHVINFDVPMHPDDYVHRIGRTGRAGKMGTAISIVTEDDRRYIEAILQLIGRDVEWDGPRLEDLPPDEGSHRSPDRGRGDRNRRGKRPSDNRSDTKPERSSRHRRTARAVDETSDASSPDIQFAETDTGAVAVTETRERPRRGSRPPRNARRDMHEIAPADQIDQPDASFAEQPRAQRPERPERQPRTDQARTDQARQERAQQDQPRQDRPERSARNHDRERPQRRDYQDNDPPVVGLGDHVPSFLLRPVPARRPRSPAPAIAEE